MICITAAARVVTCHMADQGFLDGVAVAPSALTLAPAMVTVREPAPPGEPGTGTIRGESGVRVDGGGGGGGVTETTGGIGGIGGMGGIGGIGGSDGWCGGGVTGSSGGCAAFGDSGAIGDDVSRDGDGGIVGAPPRG